jgi:GT2 family glycosyltransferase
MIAFGTAITDSRVYEAFAERGIELVAEPDSKIYAFGSAVSLFTTYNMILDEAAELEDLECLILLHQDAEIVDPNLLQTVRETLENEDVALVGCGGAVGVQNISWWEGSVTWAGFTTKFDEMGGGEIPGLSWNPEETPSYAHTGEVETIDGFVIAMSPWAVKNLRFDESLGSKLHGYDLDLCLQARAAGKKVMTADFRVVHHHSLDLIGDVDGWVAAHMKIAEKWDDSLRNGSGDDWKHRARRAEAEAAVGRLQLRVAQHFVNVRTAELDAVKQSKSWKWMAPLRNLTAFLRRLRHPRRSRVEAPTSDVRRNWLIR